VIARAFDEAERRDLKHRAPGSRWWTGATHQIQRIKYETNRRHVKVTIICD
jgi:hypothetical protein